MTCRTVVLLNWLGNLAKLCWSRIDPKREVEGPKGSIDSVRRSSIVSNAMSNEIFMSFRILDGNNLVCMTDHVRQVARKSGRPRDWLEELMSIQTACRDRERYQITPKRGAGISKTRLRTKPFREARCQPSCFLCKRLRAALTQKEDHTSSRKTGSIVDLVVWWSWYRVASSAINEYSTYDKYRKRVEDLGISIVFSQCAGTETMMYEI